jgi:hypothetical protein
MLLIVSLIKGGAVFLFQASQFRICHSKVAVYPAPQAVMEKLEMGEAYM